MNLEKQILLEKQRDKFQEKKKREWEVLQDQRKGEAEENKRLNEEMEKEMSIIFEKLIKTY